MLKKQRLLIISILLPILIATSVAWFILRNRVQEIELITGSVEIEYGETYYPNLEEIVDLEKFKISGEDVKISTLENEEGKTYPGIGEHKLKVTYKRQELFQIVKVADLTLPELQVPEVLEFEYGADLSAYDFKSQCKATDLSELSDYEIDTSTVNATIPGEYIIKVSISDEHGNRTEKEVKAVIKEEIKEEVSSEASNSNLGNTSRNNNTSNATASNNSSSNIENSTNNNSSSSNTSQSAKPTTTTPIVEHCTNNNNHGVGDLTIGVGNCGRWYNTIEEGLAHYKEEQAKWDKLWAVDKTITIEEYDANCPSGYQRWSCPGCGKWTYDWYKYN